MPNIVQSVPYGYEPPVDREKGTLVFYDTFEETTDSELDLAVKCAVARSFTKLVLYPIHEETMRRMSKKAAVSPYYKREKRLYEWLLERGNKITTIDGWEGKRKKYTPIDSALRHLTETLAAPHFIFVTPETANLFASFASFEEWIVKIRLILIAEPHIIHPKLEQYRHRWDIVNY
ncbi:hypothetical protein [Cohnella abietis]|uniref:Uncharacterized protein n=1 Tax=Cohnella abietis TaxID=2507935 RepID=A0A3T1D4D7_9BACL|nr:hypothetical protein [Cohnella abietis]BBI32964.1 hypothetical protein KCTCHS21_23630 [Cohnella abietis]